MERNIVRMLLMMMMMMTMMVSCFMWYSGELASVRVVCVESNDESTKHG